MIVNLPCLMFVTVNVLWLFLVVRSVIVLFPDTSLTLGSNYDEKMILLH